jgi:hypothetical protein
LLAPLQVLREAIKAVPAVRYALGVAGIAAAVAVIRSLVVGSPTAIALEIVGTFIGMTALVVFARLSALPHAQLKYPAIVLAWFSVALLIAISVTTLTSAVFHWPITRLPWEPEPAQANTSVRQERANLADWARSRIMSANPCIDELEREKQQLDEVRKSVPALRQNPQFLVLGELNGGAELEGQSMKDALQAMTAIPTLGSDGDSQPFSERPSSIKSYPGNWNRVLVNDDISGFKTDEDGVRELKYYVNAYVDGYCRYALRVPANLTILNELKKQFPAEK